MPAAGDRPIVDASVRFEDALAAAVKIKLHIVNQLWAELVIAKSKAQAATRQSSEWVESQFDSITNACRRFLDYTAAKSADDAAILLAGLAYVLQRASRLERLRESAFTTGERLEPKYGRVEAYKQYARSAGWKLIVDALVEKGLFRWQAGRCLPQRGSSLPVGGTQLLSHWRLDERTVEWWHGGSTH